MHLPVPNSTFKCNYNLCQIPSEPQHGTGTHGGSWHELHATAYGTRPHSGKPPSRRLVPDGDRVARAARCYVLRRSVRGYGTGVGAPMHAHPQKRVGLCASRTPPPHTPLRHRLPETRTHRIAALPRAFAHTGFGFGCRPTRGAAPAPRVNAAQARRLIYGVVVSL